MIEKTAWHFSLQGSSAEIGSSLGIKIKAIPGAAEQCLFPDGLLSESVEKQMFKLFQEFCPGINEEVGAFAEELGIPAGRVFYYLSTYLQPGCSQLALLPSRTEDGHTWLARNYEFSNQLDDMTLYTTRVEGRYAHIGSAAMMFGRSDGMNEYGLAVSQTSAGFPVGNMETARKPAITGLQFWAVIRSLLENCRDVQEAIAMARQMPIAYNINLMLVDRAGNAALWETFDGHRAVQKLEAGSAGHICSTNHVLLPELKPYDPLAMRNSLVRCDMINKLMNDRGKITRDEVKSLLGSVYPQGLCCHYYDQFFGTLRSMIFDLNDGTLEICFGPADINDWHEFSLDKTCEQTEFPVKIIREQAGEGFFELIGG